MIQLAFTPEGRVSKLKELKPELDQRLREDLISRGLLRALPKIRGQRGQAICLEDKGWRWVMEHLDSELPKTEQVLMIVLKTLAGFLRVNNFDIQDVIQRKKISLEGAEAPDPLPLPPVKDELLRVAEAMGGPATQVRLKDLRANLAAYSRSQVDAAILDLQSDGTLSVIPIDLPTDIDESDAQAAIDIAGKQRHAILVRRRSGA